ncbi:MAG TPA: methyltransferase, partial [Flavobacteriaceae bacterium]|nr:methyltransferase [Flavobacteriaceae bacterium]
MYEGKFPKKRYKITIDFLNEVISPGSKILDLGVENPFSEIMKQHGYQVENTQGEDLDEEFSCVQKSDAEVVTAFEIFEHLIAPYTILKEIKAGKLVAS